MYPSELGTGPLTSWPGALTAEHARQRAPFSAPLSTTLEQLRRELRALDARHPVLEVAVPVGQWRLDGRPYASARAEHPGVVLSLPTTQVGPLRYATDLYLTWQDNLRAITLALESLRRVERYGVTRRGEQYVGFKALPATASPSETAAATLVRWAGPHADASNLDRLWRAARGAAHPDRNSGDRTGWNEVEHAAARLDLTRGA